MPLMLSDRQMIQLNPAADVEVDIEWFMNIIKETQSHNHPDLNGCAACRAALEDALAESLPFVGNSQLFADIAGKPMAAVADTLPPEVVVAAQARGRQLDWWETAETLLEELGKLGWSPQ